MTRSISIRFFEARRALQSGMGATSRTKSIRPVTNDDESGRRASGSAFIWRTSDDMSPKCNWGGNHSDGPAPSGRLSDPNPGRGHELKRLVVSLLLAGVVSITANVENAFANEPDRAPQEQQVAESYALPITPPLHQGDTGLCWMYATLSMLETNYLVRHPGSQISLSRGAMQAEAVEDRLERRVRGESTQLPEGGLAVEALTLIRKDSVVAQPDFHDIVNSDPIAEIDRTRPSYAFRIARLRKRR